MEGYTIRKMRLDEYTQVTLRYRMESGKPSEVDKHIAMGFWNRCLNTVLLQKLREPTCDPREHTSTGFRFRQRNFLRCVDCGLVMPQDEDGNLDRFFEDIRGQREEWADEDLIDSAGLGAWTAIPVSDQENSYRATAVDYNARSIDATQAIDRAVRDRQAQAQVTWENATRSWVDSARRWRAST